MGKAQCHVTWLLHFWLVSQSKVTPKGQFSTLLCFVSLPIRQDFSVHMLESLKCRCFQRGIACDIAMPCRPQKSRRQIEARESNQLVASPMLKCLFEKTDYIRLLFHIVLMLVDCYRWFILLSKVMKQCGDEIIWLDSPHIQRSRGDEINGMTDWTCTGKWRCLFG